MAGVDVAYYLIHALGTAEFERTDRENAEHVRRGGRGRPAWAAWSTWAGSPPTYRPRSSRRTCGRGSRSATMLLDSGVPTAVLRAAVIIGSGSASFEMLRYLTERLPAMITPRWVDTRIQPIAIRDVLRYLVGCGGAAGRGVPLASTSAGPDVLTYRQMMHALRRRGRAAAAAHRAGAGAHAQRCRATGSGLVTPVPSSIARPLVESLKDEVVCRRARHRRLPAGPARAGLLGFDGAGRAGAAADQGRRRGHPLVVGLGARRAQRPAAHRPRLGRRQPVRGPRARRPVAASPEALWRVIEGIGGERGWYSFPLAWRVRGLLDRSSAGSGCGAGGATRDRVYVGETIDFWRVEERDPGAAAAAARRDAAARGWPGSSSAWNGRPVGRRDSTYVQRAIFHPRGLLGHLYWWAVAPFHGIVFGGMARNIAAAAETARRPREPRVRRR